MVWDGLGRGPASLLGPVCSSLPASLSSASFAFGVGRCYMASPRCFSLLLAFQYQNGRQRVLSKKRTTGLRAQPWKCSISSGLQRSVWNPTPKARTISSRPRAAKSSAHLGLPRYPLARSIFFAGKPLINLTARSLADGLANLG